MPNTTRSVRRRVSRLLRAKIRAGERPEALAVACGVSDATIRRWIKGDVLPPATRVPWLLQALGA